MDRFGCCSKTLLRTSLCDSRDVDSSFEEVRGFKAVVIFDHIVVDTVGRTLGNALMVGSRNDRRHMRDNPNNAFLHVTVNNSTWP